MGPLPQEPRPKRSFKSVAPVTPQATTPEPPKEPPKSVLGFAENALDDTWGTIKGLFMAIPDTLKLAGGYIANPEQYKKDVNALFTTASGKEAAKEFGWALMPFGEVIRKGPGVLYEKPFSAGVVEVLNAVQLAALTAKSTGAMAKASGAIEKGNKLIKAGEFLEKLPSRVAMGAIDKGVLKATGGAVDLSKGRGMKVLKGEEISRGLADTQSKLDEFRPVFKAMPEEAETKLNALFRAGALPGEADTALAPQWRKWREMAGEMTEDFKSRGLLNDQQIETAMLKKMAQHIDGEINPASMEKARQRLELLKKTPGSVLPIYVPNVWTGQGARKLKIENVLEDLVTGGDEIVEGKVKNLEALKGAKGYSTKPSEYIPRAIADYYATRSKLRLGDRVIESGIGKGPGLEGFKARGVPEGVFRKYYDDPIRAKDLAQITDPTVQRFLRGEYVSNPNDLVKLYDKVMRAFSYQATVMNPKFHIGQWVGDAVLGALAGADYRNAMKVLKSKAGPSRLTADVGIARDVEKTFQTTTTLGKVLEKGSDIAQIPDALARAGIFAKSAIPKLEKMGYSFEAGAKSMKDALRSTERTSDLMVDLRRTREAIERADPRALKYNNVIAKLQRKEAKLDALVKATNQSVQAGLEKKALAGKAKDLRRLHSERRNLERLKAHLAKAEENQRVFRAVQTRADVEAVVALQKKVAESESRILSLDRRFRAQKQAKPFGPERMAQAVGSSADPRFNRYLDELNTIRQRIVNLTAHRDDLIGDILSNKLKIAEYEGKLKDLEPVLDVVRNAVARQNAFVGDYIGLSGFEQRVMRRIIPFYPWMKAMSMLAFRLPFLAPVKTFLWHRFAELLETTANDPDFPKRMRGYIPIGVLQDGRSVWMKVSAYSPFEGLRTERFGGLPIPAIASIVQRNPLIALGFKGFGGNTLWDASTLPYGENITLLKDGSHVQLTPDGKLREIIPQEPFVKGLLSVFPIVQQMREHLTPYWTNKYNWAGMPEPILNADGTYKYPKETWDRISNIFGISTMTRSKEDIKRQEQSKIDQSIKAYIQYLPKADLYERELILEAIKDRNRIKLEPR